MYNDQLVYKVVIRAHFGISLWTEKLALRVARHGDILAYLPIEWRKYTSCLEFVKYVLIFDHA